MEAMMGQVMAKKLKINETIKLHKVSLSSQIILFYFIFFPSVLPYLPPLSRQLLPSSLLFLLPTNQLSTTHLHSSLPLTNIHQSFLSTHYSLFSLHITNYHLLTLLTITTHYLLPSTHFPQLTDLTTTTLYSLLTTLHSHLANFTSLLTTLPHYH